MWMVTVLWTASTRADAAQGQGRREAATTVAARRGGSRSAPVRARPRACARRSRCFPVTYPASAFARRAGDVECTHGAVDELLQEQARGGRRRSCRRCSSCPRSRLELLAVLLRQRQRPHGFAGTIGSGTWSDHSSSLPMRPAILSPPPPCTPVSVARSILHPACRPSPVRVRRRMSRPSAPVLSTSTVPLRIFNTSPGRMALPLGMFSTSGT